MENSISKIIGKNISYMRKQRGLTQEELAGELGVSFQAVSKWETGQSCPDISLLPVLADFFDIHIDVFFGRTIAKEVHYDLVEELPWDDDEKIRMVVFIGKKLLDKEESVKEFTFDLEGEARDVVCHGNIQGDVIVKGSVKCGKVEGDLKAGGMVRCGDIGGCLDSGGMVNCGDIGCSLNANGMVNCGGVGGDVRAALEVTCANVGGNVVSENGSVKCANVTGQIICDSIKGNFTACGDIKCNAIEGNITLNGGILDCENIDGEIL